MKAAAAVLALFVAGFVLMTDALSQTSPTSNMAAEDQIVVSKAYDLLEALNYIAGTQEQIVGTGANAKTVQAPYSFSGDTVWAISDNIAVLRKLVGTTQDTIKNLTAQAEAKNGGPLKPTTPAVVENGRVIVTEVPSPEQRALAAAIQALFDSTKPIGKLRRIKRIDLNVGENRIPGRVLASLDIILDQ